MSKFFVPTSWENLAEAIKFRSKGSVSGNVNATQNAKAKVKKVKKKKGHLNPNRLLSKPNVKPIVTVKSSTKVRNGRIQKKISKKVTKICSQKEIKSIGNNLKAGGDGSEIAEKRLKTEKSFSVVKVPSTTSMTQDMSEADSEDGAPPTDPDEDIGLKIFEESLKEQLMGGRFRYINEQLYTMDSKEAEEFFKSDAEAFDAYHAGYQQQVEKWPLNPLDRIIKTILRMPKTLDIADFGCGEGRLAASVPNKVYSMDLVSTRDDIIACDMANTPLANQSVDIAVYCLSLMGTNLREYILEANRVLRLQGVIIIAEIQSRFDDLRKFLTGLQACGFELVKKDVNEELFYFFQLKKVRNVGKVANVPAFSLKPCLYRKR